MSTYTRQKARAKYRNRIRLEKAALKEHIAVRQSPYQRVKRCQERKKIAALAAELMQMENAENMFTLHKECKVSTEEKGGDMVEVKCEANETSFDCSGNYMDLRAETSGVSGMQSQPIKAETEELLPDNFVCIKEEPRESDTEYSCDLDYADARELKLKTEEIDLGYDCAEHSDEKSADGTPITPQVQCAVEKRTQKPEKSHVCDICEKKFYVKSKLDQHMLSHTGERPHTCTICNKSFAFISVLNRHMKIHTGEKPHDCPICKMQFAQKLNLNRHMFTHSGEKPQQCTVCDRKFTTKNDLQRHVLTHTGEKPFPCQMCQKKFASKCNLNRHMSMHRDEKPYACQVCGKKIRDSSNLRKHMLVHAGKRPK